MNYMLNTLLVSEDEQKRLRDMEQAKKLGFKYIKVISEGEIVRIHSVDTIAVDEQPSAVFGKPEYTTRASQGILEFKIDPLTGDKQTDLLDTDFNRYWLSNQISLGIRAKDEKIHEEILALQDKEYKMEMTREEAITRQVRELEREKKRLGNIRRDAEKRDEQARIRTVKEKPDIKQIVVPENTTEGV